jgi:hypothetical protein
MALTLVSKKSVSTNVSRFIFSWLGIKRGGPYRYTFSDGYVFQPYPRSTLIPDWSWILRGCSDVTGTKFQKYVELIGAKGPSLNAIELTGPYTVRAGDPSLKNIADYDGPLTSDPKTWPEPYRSAYKG